LDVRSQNPGSSLRKWSVFVWIAASLHFALYYTLNTDFTIDLHEFAHGHARTPFQYRALTAWIYAFAERFLPLPGALVRHLPPAMASIDIFVFCAIAAASLLMAVYAVRKALEALGVAADAARWWSLLVLFMAYFHYLLAFGHPCCRPISGPYDLPSLAFFAVGLYLLFAGKTLWLYPLILLGAANRESIVFLIGIYVLYSFGMIRAGRSSAKPMMVLLHGALLFICCLLVMRGMHHLYADAPKGITSAGPFEIHVRDNLGYLFKPYYWTSFASLFGFSWLYVYANWRRIPHPGVRWAMAIGPLMLGAMYVVGVLSEVRIFGELVSLFTVALTLLLRETFAKPEASA